MSASSTSQTFDAVSEERARAGRMTLFARQAARFMTPSRPAAECTARYGVLGRNLLLTYLVLLLNSIGLLRSADLSHPVSWIYVGAVHLTYCAMFAIVALAPAFVLNTALWSESLARSRGARWSVLGLALLGGASVQLLIFGDGMIFYMYGFHMNGFVWNLVSTPGGIASMGATTGTQWTIALVALGMIAAQAGLLALASRSAWLRRVSARVFGKRMIAALAFLLVLMSASERVAYGLCSLRGYAPILSSAGTVPFYTRSRMRSFGLRLGIEEVRDGSVKMSLGSGGLHYPRTPLVRAPDARNLNVVWLVAESWRYDMLDPEIMPETSAFAARAQRFRHHYSGGNGTRMGMFSMFYGLYGLYWFQFLEATRSPVVMDTLMDANYDIDVRTSARFTYPEFNRTIFSRLPDERMHEENPDLSGWENDRANVTALIDSIENRNDPKQPFMRFLFLESAHAPYHFPKKSIIKRPFKRRLNYVTMNLTTDIPQVLNSYKNANHHLDGQFGRVVEYLDESGLLDSTIVIMTGDHGEEFMEKGHWGHHSTFVEEQTRTPLVIWMPGKPAAEYDRLTSHLDIAPTILSALGVTTPPEEYSLGNDLMGDTVRDHVVVSDWKRLAVVDDDVKIVAPVRDAALRTGYVTTADDDPVADASAIYARLSKRMLEELRGLGRFSR